MASHLGRGTFGALHTYTLADALQPFALAVTLIGLLFPLAALLYRRSNRARAEVMPQVWDETRVKPAVMPQVWWNETTMSKLGVDALEAVARHLSPREVGRLRRVCRDLAVVAEPRHPSWALLRDHVKQDGWHFARLVAADHGDIQALRWVGAQGHALGPACQPAASGGHVHLLQWLHSRTPPDTWDAELLAMAAIEGCLEAVQWLKLRAEPPCPWDKRACEYAARYGHIEVLRFLRSEVPPCPWDEDACAMAAWEGQLEALQWLRGQSPPCPWDQRACETAAINGQLEVLQWLRRQVPPCPWDPFKMEYAASGNPMGVIPMKRHPHVVAWVRKEIKRHG